MALLLLSALSSPCPRPAHILLPFSAHYPARRLLAGWVEKARRAGVAPQRVVTWVRRKLGGDVTVFRHKADGSLACAAPCVWCHKELLRFDLRVHCSLGGDAFFSGKLSDPGAPAPALTGGQQRMLRPSWVKQQKRQQRQQR